MKKRWFLKGLFIVFILITFTTTSLAISLDIGSRGEEVKEIQTMLSELGYSLKVDGLYGHRTKNVIKSFQLNNKLQVDGVVGKKTFELLKDMTEEIKYIVKKGDTLSEIAQKFDTTIEDIKSRNYISSDKIIIGQELSIPKTGIGGGEERRLYSNIIHEVQPGDSLYLLAKKYGTNVNTIKLANNLKDNQIVIGENLVIPHTSNKTSRQFRLGKSSFIWPVLGRISSDFGQRSHPINNINEFHQGVDIAVPLGEEIRAAASGKVIQSGWIKGFGKTVIIQHGKGVETLYAHNSRLLVQNGSQVKVGDIIALAGSTGLSTGSHLHFGVLVNNKPVDPKKYLP